MYRININDDVCIVYDNVCKILRGKMKKKLSYQINTMYIKGWVVTAKVDDDGHLNVFIKHEDGSEVVSCDCDIQIDDEEWANRFATKNIEQNYIDNSE